MRENNRLKTIALWSLVGVNAVLLTTFASRLWKDDAAVAQSATGAPGEYLMIPGEVLGGVNSVVYVVNESTHQLGAMSYDDANKQLITMPPRDLIRDFDSVNGRPRPR